MSRHIEKKILILAFAVLFFSPVFVKAQQVDISVSAEVRGTSTPPIVPPPEPPLFPGGAFFVPSETKVILKGRAYPSAIITILKNGQVISTLLAEKSGLFEREISGFIAGTFTFSIFAEDTDGRVSETLNFTTTILESRITTISGIFLPPTIILNPRQVEKGDEIEISGQSFPESEINIFIFPEEIVKKTKTSFQGVWTNKLETSLLEEREYTAKAKAIYGEGEQSPFSQAISFVILKGRCRGADLNFDGKVDLVDFSILLYYWGQKNPKNSCVDINSDGIVNIVDFSIMMYWWSE